MVSGISAALSGYNAAIAHIDVAASNIANQASTQGIDQTGRTANAPYVPQQVVQSSNATGGVTTGLTPVTPASVSAYDPTNPGANARGMVQAPDVDPTQQRLAATVASYDARANLKSIRLQDEMMRQVLNIVS